MNFVIDPRASKAEKMAAIERGLDAMFGAAMAEGQSGVGLEAAFVIGGGDEDKDAKKTDVSKTLSDSEDETESLCEGTGGCGEDPCVFTTHRDSLVAFDECEHGSLAIEDLPPNNIRRKKLYRQLTLMINGGPLGAGVRVPLPTCCVSEIREMLASDTGTYMGFHAE
jgi:hypothetical protein